MCFGGYFYDQEKGSWCECPELASHPESVSMWKNPEPRGQEEEIERRVHSPNYSSVENRLIIGRHF